MYWKVVSYVIPRVMFIPGWAAFGTFVLFGGASPWLGFALGCLLGLLFGMFFVHVTDYWACLLFGPVNEEEEESCQPKGRLHMDSRKRPP
jgi:hypothetical protein